MKTASPDLTDPIQRAAYRRELRAFARPWRWLGIALILGGAVVVLVRGRGFDPLSLTMVAAGWVVFIGVIVARTRYHKSRMGRGGGTPAS